MELQDKMNEELAMEFFHGGLDCSQVVFGHCAERLGLDEETAAKIASMFGAGMWSGNICGCVTGALMALGAIYGHSELGNQKSKDLALSKKVEFERRFQEIEESNGSLLCRGILGYDFSKPEDIEKILENNLLDEICPVVTAQVCDILDDMMDEAGV
ncbi:MAG: C-GCAxxG-C-C family protein [Anaerovoracaceae bacterium]